MAGAGFIGGRGRWSTSARSFDVGAQRATVAGGAAHGGHAHPDLPSKELCVEFVTDVAELERWVPAWRRLAEVAAEPNVFFEPEVLLPTLRRLGSGGSTVGAVLVFASPRQHPEGDPVLAGLFPFRRSRGQGELWLSRYAYEGTPLIREDSMDAVWNAFLEQVHAATGAPVVCFPKLGMDTVLFPSLVRAVHTRGAATWIQDQFLRATFHRRADADAFLQESMSRKVRRNLNRQRRLLGERGDVTFELERPGTGEVDRLALEFLALEAGGWKGENGTALASRAPDRAWFGDVANGLAESRRLCVAALRLDGRAVAMGVLMLQACGTNEPESAAYFKIAFDESLADLSVGTLLQVELVRALHAADVAGPLMVDSCANPGHPMIEHVWRDRRMMQTLWVATSPRLGPAMLTALPAARGAKQLLRRKGRRRDPRKTNGSTASSQKGRGPKQ